MKEQQRPLLRFIFAFSQRLFPATSRIDLFELLAVEFASLSDGTASNIT